MKLAAIKAVDDNYPLKGKVTLSQSLYAEGQTSNKTIQPGEIWLESKLVEALSIGIGDSVELGDAEFKLTQILAATPDKTISVFGQSPEALIHFLDVPKTQVIQPGSRVDYRSHVTGNESELKRYEAWLKPQLNRDIYKWYSIKQDNSAIGKALNKAEQYLLLASLLSIVLAATAIGIAAKRYAERHYDFVAILKTLGASSQIIKKTFALHAFILITSGIILGLCLGYLAQELVLYALADMLPETMAATSLQPYFLAICTGLLCAGLFLILPLMQLFKIPPLRILRNNLTSSPQGQLMRWSMSSFCLFCLMYLYSQNFKLSLILLLGSAVTVLILYSIAQGLFSLLRTLNRGGASALKLALARLYQRAHANSFALIAFTLALQLLLVVWVLKGDLVAQWQAQLKTGTPNYFVMNLPQEQRKAFSNDLANRNINLGSLYPIYRGRLVAVNDEVLKDKIVDDANQTKGEANQRVSIGRELSLTTIGDLPKGNVITQGQWLSNSSAVAEVSIEQGIAKRLNIQLTDELVFDVGGQSVIATVTSIRKVDWQSMSANFYMIFNAVVFEDHPTSYIASFYLPAELKAAINHIMAPYPSASFIDIEAILNQVQTISKQTAIAIEFIFVLVLLASILVLLTQIQASLTERKKELFILRTLGVNNRLIKRSVLLEFAVLGACAGLFAALLSEISLYALKTQVLKMVTEFNYLYWLVTPSIGALILVIIGYWRCSELLKLPYQQMKTD